MTRRNWLLAAAAPLTAKTTTLFNGRDLTGWRRAGNGIWTVEDGAIVARFDRARPGPGYLFTDQEFTDCKLSLEFWISPKGNSGIYVHQPWRTFGIKGDQRPAHSPGDGVEVQIDYQDGKNLTGAVYNQRKPDLVVGAEERWNRIELECTGPRLRVSVDGKLVNDFSPLPSPRGAFGFQMHGTQPHDHVVKFRNVKLV